MGKSPKKAEKTGQEVAAEQRQARQLDEEIGKSEKSLKALSRGKIGSKSLLSSSGDKSMSTAIKPAEKKKSLIK